MSAELSEAVLPDRFVDNWQSGYAKFHLYPKNRAELTKWVDDAFDARDDEEKINSVKNGRPKLKKNLTPSQPADRPSVAPKLMAPTQATMQLTRLWPGQQAPRFHGRRLRGLPTSTSERNDDNRVEGHSVASEAPTSARGWNGLTSGCG